MMSMDIQDFFHNSICCILLSFLFIPCSVAAPVGICYGRVANNLPPPKSVVNILKTNGISNVRVFNTDPAVLRSLAGSEISLMIGVPNEDLPSLASGTFSYSLQWLQTNIFAYVPAKQVRYIAVGNEVFLKDPYYSPHVVPAIFNLHNALQALGLSENVKLSSPQAASVLINTYPPSHAEFDPDLHSSMIPLLRFLSDTGSPFMANVYPYISYVNNAKYMSSDYALFRSGNGNSVQDGTCVYNNLYDASLDAFAYAMEKAGFPGVEVLVAETGWPTAGGEAANVANAMDYNGNVVHRTIGDVGTPRRPGVGVEVYLFDLFDENEKGGEDYEKHFGIFWGDGFKVYNLTFN